MIHCASETPHNKMFVSETPTGGAIARWDLAIDMDSDTTKCTERILSQHSDGDQER